MPVILLLALQVAATSAVSEPPFFNRDVSNIAASRALELTLPRCAEREGLEIVVCGRRSNNSRYRVPAPSTQYENKAVTAEAGLGKGATAGVYVDSVELPGGLTSNRVMITLKLPF